MADSLFGNFDKVEEKEELNRELVLGSYSLDLEVEDEVKTYLEDQTVKIHGTASKMYTELGEIFTEVQGRLSSHHGGVFEKWYTSLGFDKKSVYRLINRNKLVVSKWHDRKTIESLPVTLSYEIAEPNCPPELVEAVLKGEIKTLKEFKERKSLGNTRMKEVNEEFKPFTPFYKPIFSFEKKIGKMTSKESHKALEELREVKKEVARLEKLLKAKEEAAALENNLKLVD